MTSLLARLRGGDETPALRSGSFAALSFDQWVNQVLHFDGNLYPSLNSGTQPKNTLHEYATRIANSNGVISAAISTRMLLLKQVRFVFRRTGRQDADYGQLFGSRELLPLEQPDPGRVTLPQFLATLELHVSLAGNAFVRRVGDRLEILDPDKVDVVLVDSAESGDPQRARKGGYLYWPDGRGEGKARVPLLLGEVAHWMPEPHPTMWWAGQSWITAVVREALLDKGGTDYLQAFFEKAATPNMIVRPSPALAPEKVKEFKELFADKHEGVSNAFRTMWLGGGSDVTIVGSKLSDLDLKDLQGGLETRIAARSRVPAVILGIREGLAGSSLNAGNYTAARRMLADGWFSPTVADLCATLQHLVSPPPGGPAELWHDPDMILFLQEDARDTADILAQQATAIRTLVDAGFDPGTAVDAVRNNNLAVLNHTGLLSVQLNAPGSGGALPTGDTQQ